ncbi:hypothetical protein GCM10022220_24480 [Actinocatenispora rupis]
MSRFGSPSFRSDAVTVSTGWDTTRSRRDGAELAEAAVSPASEAGRMVGAGERKGPERAGHAAAFSGHCIGRPGAYGVLRWGK